MERSRFNERNRRFGIPEHELDRMYRVHQEQMMLEQMMLEAARQGSAISSPAGGGGGESSSAVVYDLAMSISVGNDGQSFTFWLQTGVILGTDLVIDWGDGGPIEELTQAVDTFVSYTYSYDIAGTYTIGINFSDPESIIVIQANQND